MRKAPHGPPAPRKSVCGNGGHEIRHVVGEPRYLFGDIAILGKYRHFHLEPAAVYLAAGGEVFDLVGKPLPVFLNIEVGA